MLYDITLAEEVRLNIGNGYYYAVDKNGYVSHGNIEFAGELEVGIIKKTEFNTFIMTFGVENNYCPTATGLKNLARLIELVENEAIQKVQ